MDFTSYERVLAALQHKEPDRVPFDMGATAVTAINVNALRNLKSYMGIPGEVTLWDKITQVAVTDKETTDRLQVDVGRVGPNAPSAPNFAADLGLVGDHYRQIDEWGIGWHMPRVGGHYYDLYLHPLANAETIKDVETFSWPDPLDPARFIGMQAAADRVVHEEKKLFILKSKFFVGKD